MNDNDVEPNPYDELGSCLRTMAEGRNAESTKNLLDVLAKAMTTHMPKQLHHTKQVLGVTSTELTSGLEIRDTAHSDK